MKSIGRNTDKNWNQLLRHWALLINPFLIEVVISKASI